MSYDDGRVDELNSFQRKATIVPPACNSKSNLFQPIIATASASALTTSALLIYLAISDFKAWRLSKTGRKRDSYFRQLSRAKFKNQGYFWLVNLFFAGIEPNLQPHLSHVLIPDFVQSIGWALSSYNLAHNRLWPGFACNVQGFFINVGDVGSSVWSLVIAIHTVLLLVGGQRTRVWAAEKSTGGKGRWILCLSIWASLIFLGLIGPLAVEKIHPDRGPFCNLHFIQ